MKRQSIFNLAKNKNISLEFLNWNFSSSSVLELAKKSYPLLRKTKLPLEAVDGIVTRAEQSFAIAFSDQDKTDRLIFNLLPLFLLNGSISKSV